MKVYQEPVTGMIHSKNGMGSMTILERIGNCNDYIVRTEDGVKCHAIFNPFTGLFYADDKYAIVKE